MGAAALNSEAKEVVGAEGLHGTCGSEARASSVEYQVRLQQLATRQQCGRAHNNAGSSEASYACMACWRLKSLSKNTGT